MYDIFTVTFTMIYYSRFLVPYDSSFILLGPRGTGKSLWLKNHLPQAILIDLLDESLYQKYLAQPEAFANRMRLCKEGEWVIVDEIQRLPQLLNYIHKFIEERGIKFALCGSSARKLRRDGVNLLGGRLLLVNMFPFLPSEIGADFSLEKSLEIGLLPIIWNSMTPTATLKSYTQLYLKEEIQAEALVRNLAGFTRFLPMAALFHGQILNVNALARDAGIARSTVEGFLQILEDTMLAFRLPAFTPKLRVREKNHPKLYWIDNGLVRSLKNSSGPVVSEEKGALFEGLIAMILRAENSYRREPWHGISFWASGSSSEIEVDFVLQHERGLTLIEVKASPRFRPDMIKGLRSFQWPEKVCRRILVYLGSETELTADGIEVRGFQNFLEEITLNQLK